MRIQTTLQKLETATADLTVVNLFADEKHPGGGTGAVDKKLKGLLTKKIKDLHFSGSQAGEYFICDNPSRGGARYILVVSLGPRKKFTLNAVRTVAAVTVQVAKQYRAQSIATILHGAGIGGLYPEAAAQAVTEGLLLADYTYTAYQKEQATEEKRYKLRTVTICQKDKVHLSEIKRGIQLGNIFAAGQLFARDLVNEPPVTMHPSALADTAKNIAKQNPHITVKILNKKQIREMGMNAYLAVDSGSNQDPYFIHLTYKPQEKPNKKIVLIGKSITFDSGGLSLKPTENMINMKNDMAGGAAVLGIFSELEKLKPELEIHGLLAACENMPSGSSMKVGDIVKAMNGKTVEILNTDAEGRLTLADALAYAEQLKPDVMIDLATLTGSALVALGTDIAALMTNDDDLSQVLERASQITGEKIWRMPLEPSYNTHLKSNFADIQNVGKPRGIAGVISAGLFLQNFVNHTPWAHLDIAGPAWKDDKSVPYLSIGGTGFGVRLLLQYLIQNP